MAAPIAMPSTVCVTETWMDRLVLMFYEIALEI